MSIKPLRNEIFEVELKKYNERLDAIINLNTYNKVKGYVYHKTISFENIRSNQKPETLLLLQQFVLTLMTYYPNSNKKVLMKDVIKKISLITLEDLNNYKYTAKYLDNVYMRKHPHSILYSTDMYELIVVNQQSNNNIYEIHTFTIKQSDITANDLLKLLQKDTFINSNIYNVKIDEIICYIVNSIAFTQDMFDVKLSTVYNYKKSLFDSENYYKVLKEYLIK